MKDRLNSAILIAILVCLLFIAFKPGPSLNVTGQPVVNQLDPGTSVIPLGENRLAVIDNRSNSGMFGTVLVFEYNSRKATFELKSNFSYADYFRNPQKYNLGQ